MFTRLAVVNRGEPAVRLIRAVRELNEESRYGIKVIALHTRAEQRALFVRAADEAVCLRDDVEAASPYLDHTELERALKASRADAVWVGWGFVAEDPKFAELVERLGLVFVGPSPDSMRRLGDKIEAKLLAEQNDVPVAPWSGGPVESLDDARKHAETIGYPFMLKARSGGGGRGIRKVESAEELESAFERTQAEAKATFGDPVVFMESLVSGGRHIEVQVIADTHGTVWAPGVRDCSIQRRNQKLIEESGSPVLTEEQMSELRTASKKLVAAADYRGAGTVEYLYQPEDRTFAFMEVNTRLQVEHPVTEATTGLDLVKLQLLVAAGERLEGEEPPEIGHAIEARLNAEDAEEGFAPAPGTVTLLTQPTGPGVRFDTGVAVGEAISPEYDSMVGKVIAWGQDRSEALARLRCALRDMTVLIQGGTTTKSFLLDVLSRPEVVSGEADTQWLDRVGAEMAETPTQYADIALLSVAISVYDAEEALEREAFLASARGGRPRATHTIGRTIELGYQGQPYTFVAAQVGPQRYRLEIGDEAAVVELDRLNDYQTRLVVAGRRHEVSTVAGTGSYLVEVDGFTHRVVRDEAGVIRASAPAVVVSMPVQQGDEVEAGATVAVLESMKMETAVRAPSAGVVREVLAVVNSQVDAGAPLLRLDQASTGAEQSDAPSVSFKEAVGTDSDELRSKPFRILDDLNALVTGYDVSGKRGLSLVREYLRARDTPDPADGDVLEGEVALLTTFADLADLSRNRPSGEEESADEQVHSPREYFHTYLRSVDVDQEDLPESFRQRLSRAVRHHQVTDLERSPELDEAVYRVFLAQQRGGDHVPVVAALLESWLAHADAMTDTERDKVGEVIDRLVNATQLRYPTLGNLSRSLRFQVFEQPLIAQARAEAYAGLQEHLEQVEADPDGSGRAEHIGAMVGLTEPVIAQLGIRTVADSHRAEPLLEVLSRRYYKVRTLENVEQFMRDGRQFVTGDFDLAGSRLHLVAAVTDFEGLAATADSVAGLARDVADPGNLVTDLFVSWPEAPEDSDEVSSTLQGLLSDVELVSGGRRITVTVFSGTGDTVRQVTFRPAEAESGEVGLSEDRVIRDMHPLTGQRLDLWRLKNFDGTRIPSPTDTYLFHITAKDNPADERIAALAEVRDVTPLRDSNGQVVAFPAVERALTACLDGIRRQMASTRGGDRLDANRVFIYIWPTIEVSVDDLDRFARSTAPLTVGAGLEEIMLLGQLQGENGTPEEVALRFSYTPGRGVQVSASEPPTEPLEPLNAYTQKVQRSRARGTVYPYELVSQVAGPKGTFAEYDLDESSKLVPVDREPGKNKAGIVAGLVTTPTERYPEGMTRVALFGDPTKALGSVSEPECAIVNGALDLAEELQVPVEWFALSSGAKISMDSGTENMDWVARTLRRLIEFTQRGGEVNVVVAGINVGAQPYWNAEATMLLHTKGILVMTPDSAMVLTGKQSLDYSGGVSAEDNYGIGGYDRVMGPNGQAQYWAPNLAAAIEVLFAHYDHTYVAPGESMPRRAETEDPHDRDVRDFPHDHPISDFTTVGDIFSSTANPERKKAFDIRTVMKALVDQDHEVLERWAGMADADTTVVLDAHLGGYPVAVLGIESRPIPRRGALATDGPDQWTAGTLFPMSSKKTARAINAASGNRPLVVVANLSGFDGSPESLRKMQLEYGAEIGRAMVNFDGPIVFCVVSRYHGGAFVVFSGVLNDNMEVVAVEGSYASVIGGAPAAAVVFAREVTSRTTKDSRVAALADDLAQADEGRQAQLRIELADLRTSVRSEKLGEVADEFEQVHNIERALAVGSVHAIIPARELRPYLIGAVERGIARSSADPTSGAAT